MVENAVDCTMQSTCPTCLTVNKYDNDGSCVKCGGKLLPPLTESDVQHAFNCWNYPPLLLVNGLACVALLAALVVGGIFYLLVQQSVVGGLVQLAGGIVLWLAVIYSIGPLSSRRDAESCSMLMMTHPERYSGLAVVIKMFTLAKWLCFVALGIFQYSGALWILIIAFVFALVATLIRDKSIAGRWPSWPSILFLAAVAMETGVVRLAMAIWGFKAGG